MRNGQVQGHPMILLWSVVCSFSVLAGGVLCSVLPVEAKVDYEIINTGIKGGGCWVDDNHFLVEKRVEHQGSQVSDLEGLYFLNPRHPADIESISLAPLEPSAQKRVWQVACQDGAITFLVPGTKKGSSRLYRLRIGEVPELIVEMRAPRVSLQGKYVLGNSHRAVMDGGPLQGVFEGNDDCLLADVKPGFRVLCWDSWLVIPQPLPQFVFSKYLWEESLKIREPNGQTKWVPNPKPPLRRADGTKVTLGFFLRDLDSRIVREIPLQQDDYRYDTIHLKLDPQGHYLYCPCWKAGDHGGKSYTVGGRICRFQLDGQNQRWEEVVSVQRSQRDPFSLQDLDVNGQGDVVMIERGHRLLATLWIYRAQPGTVDKLLQVRFPDELGGPQVSPNSQWVIVERQGGRLVLIERKGVQS
jgi:hypothetical protein